MKELTSKIWNGLFYGSQRKIVQKLNHIDENDLWIAVYDVPKSKSPLLPDFLRNASTRFCIIVFRYKSGTDLLEEGFMKEYFQQERVEYVNSKEEILVLLNELKINVELFDYPSKVDFPMGT